MRIFANLTPIHSSVENGALFENKKEAVDYALEFLEHPDYVYSDRIGTDLKLYARDLGRGYGRGFSSGGKFYGISMQRYRPRNSPTKRNLWTVDIYEISPELLDTMNAVLFQESATFSFSPLR